MVGQEELRVIGQVENLDSELDEFGIVALGKVLETGEIDIERYRSDGKILGEDALEELFALWSDDQGAGVDSEKTDDIVARN